MYIQVQNFQLACCFRIFTFLLTRPFAMREIEKTNQNEFLNQVRAWFT